MMNKETSEHGFCKIGVEGNLREILENTRKITFPFFSFFVI